MRYYIVYFLNLQTLKPIFYKYYDDEKIALSKIDSIALEYVKNEQGKQQADIAIQPTKSVIEIQNDTTLKEGLYLKKEGDIMIVYEKTKVALTGYIYSSYEIRMNKIGKFDVTDIDLDIPQNCTIKTKQVSPCERNCTYMDELKLRLQQSDNKFGLKNVKMV